MPADYTVATRIASQIGVTPNAVISSFTKTVGSPQTSPTALASTTPPDPSSQTYTSYDPPSTTFQTVATSSSTPQTTTTLTQTSSIATASTATSHSSSGLSTGALAAVIVVPIVLTMVIIATTATWYILRRRRSSKRQQEAAAHARYGPSEPPMTQTSTPPTPGPISSRKSSNTALAALDGAALPSTRPKTLRSVTATSGTIPSANSISNFSALPYHNSRVASNKVHGRRSVPDISAGGANILDIEAPISPFDESLQKPNPFNDPITDRSSYQYTPPTSSAMANTSPRGTFLDSDSSTTVSQTHEQSFTVPPQTSAPSPSARKLNAPPTSAPRKDESFIAPLRPQLPRSRSSLPEPPPRSPLRPLSISPITSSNNSINRPGTASPVSPIRISRHFPPPSIQGSLRPDAQPRSLTHSLARSDSEISAIDEMEVEYGQANRTNLGNVQRASVVDMSMTGWVPSRTSRMYS